MKHFRSTRLSLTGFLMVVLSLFLFSSTAQAASFSFTEFNIAFVLGLMFPVILIIALVKPLKNIRLRYPLLISLSVLLMLYALAYPKSYQSELILSSAMIFSSVLFFWLRSTYSQPAEKVNYLINFIVVATAVSFVFSLWFLPDIDGYLAWLAASLLVLACAGVTVLSSKKIKEPSSVRLTAQWFIHLCFVVILFAWLNAFISVVWLVSAIVISYLAALVNGCWYLVQAIHVELNNSDDIRQKISTAYLLDPATNLPCYQQALEKLDNVIKQQPKSRFVSIVFKPVNFQAVNTVLGHHNSDILLLQLAYCLQKKVAENILLVNFSDEQSPIKIARLQGLHFLVVLDLSTDNYPDHTKVDQLCRELMAAVPSAMSFKSFSLNFELAFGAAYMGEYSHSVSEVISFAEDALLVSEQTQQVVSYFDHNSALYTEQQLQRMEQLKQDIADEKLHWYLQPQIGLANKKVVGFHMEVHWYCDDKAPRVLNQFVDIAEHSGDIYLLTKQMIVEACKAIAQLQKVGFEKPVTITFASKELLEPALIDYIVLQAKEYSINTNSLIIEFKEALILSASQRAKAIIDQLKSLNIKIAIGDFSGSYESLRYLRKLSIHQVKINCGLLGNSDNNIESGSSDKAIINALINLTRAMKLPLIGTSINNSNIEQAFISMGGEYAQGRYLSRGVVFDEIEIWTRRWLEQYPHSEPAK
ncbi:EAL domain-containing protein [Colwellia sp. BRX8-9]|uniref:EAL domain-containing protein n=1 Tax=Colwellia sp. BRX8-9 TaxID=2759831 RepID=UPI0015F5EC2D|nr:GGDEF domain-containing phosphodiesterase [Colwellia sp. BRX8-9]MBA6346833.1 EAL domain-containing protein [Colwellia sp. BRX8-9]